MEFLILLIFHLFQKFKYNEVNDQISFKKSMSSQIQFNL